ncbi:hypothetical protein [Burkholderia seminalis]|uniref:Uncharacterized protein n=1 Tax=Burkholderia seminalis TaxID=488731 RepID=A0A8A8DF12_9BURK|nr:hypothetical protein [Burkholderia seminalis]QTO23384.1 hypothetical protein DT99_035600 [Burkholderia seminalis]
MSKNAQPTLLLNVGGIVAHDGANQCICFQPEIYAWVAPFSSFVPSTWDTWVYPALGETLALQLWDD